MIVYICTAGKLIDCIDIEVIILKQPLKSRGNMINNPDWLKLKSTSCLHQLSLECIEEIAILENFKIYFFGNNYGLLHTSIESFLYPATYPFLGWCPIQKDGGGYVLAEEIGHY